MLVVVNAFSYTYNAASSRACHLNCKKQIFQMNQLAIHKHDQAVDLGYTKKKLQLSGQSRTWTHDLHISSPAP